MVSLIRRNKTVHKLGRVVRRNAIALRNSQSTGPRIFSNTIPKSGSHLLIRLFELTPNLVRSGYAFTAHHLHEGNVVRQIPHLSRGTFTVGHMPFDGQVAQELAACDVKTLITVRDPRDLAVSMMHWIMRESDHPLYGVFQELPTDTDRLLAVIDGVDGKLPDLKTVYERYSAWETAGFLVQYEHLVGRQGGGSDTLQKKVIDGIFKHCGIDLPAEIIADIQGKVYFKKARTFRKGVIGDWVNYFDKDVLGCYQEKCETLARFEFEAAR